MKILSVIKEKLGKFLNGDRGLIVLLCLAGILVYIGGLGNGFVWDDTEQVAANTVIRDWGNLGTILTSSTFYNGGAGLAGGFYRPLVSLSYLWNYTWWELNTFGYHLFQLAFHLANISLVFSVVELILEKQKVKYARMSAFLAALLFAVHPVNVEAVAYIASVGEVMYAFCLLLAFYVYLRASNYGGREMRGKKWAVFTGLVLAGFFAKEAIVVLVPILGLYLWMFVKPKKGTYFKFAAAFLAVMAVYFYLRIAVAKIMPGFEGFAPIAKASLWERILTIPFELVSYLGMIFWPRDLSVMRHFVVRQVSDVLVWGSVLMLLLVAAVVIIGARKMKSREFLFFWFWFLAALAPALNIIPLDMTVAERWLYVPIIGVCVAVSLALAALAQKMPGKWRYAGWGLLGIMVILLGARAAVRVGDWKDEMTLFRHDAGIVARVSPRGSYDLENNYGVQLVKAGNITDGEKHLKVSVGLNPGSPFAHNNLGVVLQRTGDLEGALKQYEEAIELGYYLAYENKGEILTQMGKYQEAKEFYEESLKTFTDNRNMKLKLAKLYLENDLEPEKYDKEKARNLIYSVLGAEPKNEEAQELLKLINNEKEN